MWSKKSVSMTKKMIGYGNNIVTAVHNLHKKKGDAKVGGTWIDGREKTEYLEGRGKF